MRAAHAQCTGSMQQGPCSGPREARIGTRAQNSAALPARPLRPVPTRKRAPSALPQPLRSAAAQGGRGGARSEDVQEGRDDREKDEDLDARARAEEAEVTTAMVEMAAAVSDSTAEDTKAVDSAGAAEQTTEASEAPTANSICGARHRCAGQVQSGTFGETCGRLAWQPSR